MSSTRGAVVVWGMPPALRGLQHHGGGLLWRWQVVAWVCCCGKVPTWEAASPLPLTLAWEDLATPGQEAGLCDDENYLFYVVLDVNCKQKPLNTNSFPSSQWYHIREGNKKKKKVASSAYPFMDYSLISTLAEKHMILIWFHWSECVIKMKNYHRAVGSVREQLEYKHR